MEVAAGGGTPDEAKAAREAVIQAHRARVRRAARWARVVYWLRWFPWATRAYVITLPSPGFDRWSCDPCDGRTPATAVAVRPDSSSIPLQVGLCAEHVGRAPGRRGGRVSAIR